MHTAKQDIQFLCTKYSCLQEDEHWFVDRPHRLARIRVENLDHEIVAVVARPQPGQGRSYISHYFRVPVGIPLTAADCNMLALALAERAACITRMRTRRILMNGDLF